MIMKAALVFLCLLAATSGSGDSQVYPSGRTNPNLRYTSYYRDAQDVLDDLSSFQSLYVTFHSCVWSDMGNGASNSDACSGVADEDVWYMGRTQCQGPNVAFSLYGRLRGSKQKHGCNEDTYINSFYTTEGLQAFVDALDLAGHYVLEDDAVLDDNYGERRLANAADDGYNDDHGAANWDTVNAQCNALNNGGQFQSYGIGCDNGYFVRKHYKSAYCSESQGSKVVDRLQNYNQELRGMHCEQIYSSQGEASYEYRNNDAEGEEEDEGNAEGEANEGYSGLEYPSDLLMYSRSCNSRQSPDCPDPEGRLALYQHNWEVTLSSSFASKAGLIFRERVRRVLSWILFLSGMIMAFAARTVKRKYRSPLKPKKKDAVDKLAEVPIVRTISNASKNAIIALSRVGSGGEDLSDEEESESGSDDSTNESEGSSNGSEDELDPSRWTSIPQQKKKKAKKDAATKKDSTATDGQPRSFFRSIRGAATNQSVERMLQDIPDPVPAQPALNVVTVQHTPQPEDVPQRGRSLLGRLSSRVSQARSKSRTRNSGNNNFV